MTIFDMIEGMQILSKYIPEGESPHLAGVEQDKMFICRAFEVSPEDALRLDECGFRVDTETEMWTCFV